MLNISDSEDLTISSPTQSASKFTTSTTSTKTQPVHFGVKPQIQSDAQIAHPVAVRINKSNNTASNQQSLSYASYQTSAAESQNPSVPEPPPRHSRSSSLGAVNPASSTSTQIPPPPQQKVYTQQITHQNTAPVIYTTPKILQQQPTVPPRITSPPTVYNQLQQQAQTHHHQDATNNQTVLPPPPPPLPHNHNYHQSRILTTIQQHQQQQIVHQVSTPSNLVAKNLNQQQFHRTVPSIPQQAASTTNTNSQTSSSNPEDIHKTLERLVEQMNVINLERLKKINETKQKQTQSQDQTDILLESIRTQTEQNQVLKRVFGELEKELRSLTDQRIALEIKLDFLNTTTTNTNTISNSLSTPSISMSSAQALKKQPNQNQVINNSTANNTPAASNQNNIVSTPVSTNSNLK